MQHFEKSQFKPGDLVKYVQQMIDRRWLWGGVSSVEHYGLVQSLAIDEDGVWWGIYIVLIDGQQRWINESQLERIECAK